MRSVEMYLGERRTISVRVSSCGDEAFNIRNPFYRLKYGETVESEGEPILEDHDLTVVVEPKNVGRYVLEFTMDIANELIIRKLPLYVVK